MRTNYVRTEVLALIFFSSATLALALLLLIGMPVPVAAQTTISCANTAAIPNPESATLITDCETLLGLKDTLRGSASLNWNTSRPISQWEGVFVFNSRVKSLFIWRKGLTGSIPKELGNLSNLTSLQLYSNTLTGSIPKELGNLSNLRDLYLNNNQLTGSIPKELSNLSNLRDLYLNNNQLTGNMPPNWATSSWILRSGWERLDLSGNQLCGDWWMLRSGPDGHSDHYNRRHVRIDFPTRTCPTPTPTVTPTPTQTATPTPNPKKCANTVAIPNPESASLITDCETLLGLKDTLRGSASLNWSIQRSISQWTGVTVSSSRVTELVLQNKGLAGTIPSALGNLSQLSRLVLRQNRLTGEIPTQLGNLSRLRILGIRQITN